MLYRETGRCDPCHTFTEKLIKKYSKLLESKSNMKKQMIADMLEIKEKYAIPRKTVIADCGEVVVKKAQAVET